MQSVMSGDNSAEHRCEQRSRQAPASYYQQKGSEAAKAEAILHGRAMQAHICERIVCGNSKCVQCKRERRQAYGERRWGTQRQEARKRKLLQQQEARERKRAEHLRRQEEQERKRAPREEARRRGSTRYFTGVPCKHGHVCERMVSTNSCVECLRVKDRARPHRYRPEAKVRGRVYRARPAIVVRDRAYKARPDVRRRNWARRHKQELSLSYLRSIGADHLLKTKRAMPSGLSPAEKKRERGRRRGERLSKAFLIFEQLGLASALDTLGLNRSKT
jgi:hypothetical protein